MTKETQKAFERLFEEARFNKRMQDDLILIRRVLDEFQKEAMERVTSCGIMDAKMEALKEANKQLADQVQKSAEKFDMLKSVIGEDELAALLGSAVFDKRAEAMKKVAEEARKFKALKGGKHD